MLYKIGQTVVCVRFVAGTADRDLILNTIGKVTEVHEADYPSNAQYTVEFPAWVGTVGAKDIDSVPYRLARLAQGRASLQRGCQTARAVGDSQWAVDHREALEEYERLIEALKAVATPDELRDARDITNASI